MNSQQEIVVASFIKSHDKTFKKVIEITNTVTVYKNDQVCIENVCATGVIYVYKSTTGVKYILFSRKIPERYIFSPSDIKYLDEKSFTIQSDGLTFKVEIEESDMIKMKRA